MLCGLRVGAAILIMPKFEIGSLLGLIEKYKVAIGKELEDTVQAKFPQARLGQGYGMTEVGPILAMCFGICQGTFDIKPGACRTVVRNAEMKIVDPETGSSLPRNLPGDLHPSDQIMKAASRTIDNDGWLHTGDIGFIDDDDGFSLLTD
ncbi:hypothetical protein H0E87_006087 [Populus deltoides]|uniref:4-coumarate--CoA ligase n=1 Tax=Populus deltoides TaxID=3696 RepID=A0A8T2Z4Z1_POPDE|nr:hypothetical protein H0E87_006087 [Populus deltoides]